MKTMQRRAVVLLLVAMCCHAQAQWLQTGGPRGGRLVALASRGDAVFGGFELHGMYRSTDNGENWGIASAGLPDPEGQGMISALACTDSAVLAGLLGGIYRSTDDGASWSPAQAAPVAVMSFAVKDSVIFAGTQGAGLHRSMNHGASWVPVATPFQGYFISMAFSGATLLVGTAGDGMYRSTDLGTTWSQAGPGFPPNGYVAAIHSAPWGVLASAGGRLYRSPDRGVSWSVSDAGLPSPSLVRAVTSMDDTVFAGTAPVDSGGTWYLGGLYRSIDSGVHWTPYAGRPGSSSVEAMLSNGGRVFAGVLGGLLVSTDRGGSWRQRATGLPLQTTAALASDGLVLFAGTIGGGVATTPDGAGLWTFANEGILYGHARAIAPHAGFVFAGGGFAIARSSNGGRLWETPGFGVPGYVAALASHGGTLYAGWNGGVSASLDTGRTWSPLGFLGVSVYSLALEGDRIFAGTVSGVYTTTDRGTIWTPVNNGLPGDFPVALAVMGARVFVGGDRHGVYASTDNGGTWLRASTGLADTAVQCIFLHQNRLLVGTQRGAFASLDSGRTWFDIGSGLGQRSVLCLAVLDSMVYAGVRAGGVWQRPLAQLTTAVGEFAAADAPTECRLEQNFPNPFNPTTGIRYGLPEREHVTLTVFNTLGRKVATLVDRVMEPGRHEAVFDASGLSTGVYYYRLSAGGYAEARRMLLLK